jgi:SnoaL-like protein
VTESHTELIRPGFEAFNAKGPEGFIDFAISRDLIHPDFAFYIQEDLPNGGEWKGVDGFREMSRLWLEAWSEFTVKPLQSSEGPEGQVLLEVEQHAVGRGTGLEFDTPGFFYVIIWRDEKVAEMHLLNDRERATELAGVSG